ncbi:MAG: channel protein TolC [Methylocystaceae bacterium]|jgi:outer membrane protein|nr:channel protein TolC [Methylocystaceae bacterium]
MTRTLFILSLCSLGLVSGAHAETLNEALQRAYNNNPSLNSSRANLRAVDENVPLAKAGMRPRVSINSYLGAQQNRFIQRQDDMSQPNDPNAYPIWNRQQGQSLARSAGVTIEQPVFDGFKAQNTTNAAETAVFAEQQRLRLLEQKILFDTASSYMNVLRDTAALKLQENNVAVLTEQLRQTKERYLAGQITLTDISQAESRLAAGKAQASNAHALLESSIGAYQQVVGILPKKLAPAPPVDKLLPPNREEAEKIAVSEHPMILAALHDADASDFDIKAIEADFLPKLSVVADVFTQTNMNIIYDRNIAAMIGGRLNVPLYDGGSTSSQLRQAKELAGKKKLDVDVARAEIIALTRTTWANLQSAKTRMVAAQAQIAAAEKALYGVREEAKAGQRTTLDILNAQQELLNARIALIFAQRERVVASYGVLSTIGRLSTDNLGLSPDYYDPALHLDQIKDSWGGFHTPGGR